METLDLATLLPLSDGSLLFTPEAVPGTALATQLSSLANGLPITIRNATRTCANGKLEVKGIVNVLDHLDLPITLSAAVPAPEQLHLQAVFQLDGFQQPLQALWARMGLPTPPPDAVPANLCLHDLTLGADQAGPCWLEATMAPEPGWPLDLGPAQGALRNVKLKVLKSGVNVTSIFSGELTLGSALALAMECSTTGAFSIKEQLPSTTLRDLVQQVTHQSLPALSLFDMSFSNGSLGVTREETGLALTFTVSISGLGVSLQARRAGAGGWGFALGLSLAAGTPLGLPALEQVRQLCHLQELLLVVASFDNVAFELASLVVRNSPAASLTTGQPSALRGGLQKGLTAYASWALGSDSNQQLLRKLMPALPQQLAVLLHLNDTLTGGRMATEANFVFNKDSGNPLTFTGEFGCEIEASQVGLFLSGAMQTQLQGQPVAFDVEAEFLPTGLLLSGSMAGTVAFAPLPVSLSNLALVVGLDVEGLPSLGLAGTLNVQDFQSSVAVFFDSTNPTQSMLAGSVSNLDLLKVLKTFAPKASLPPELSGTVLQQVALTGTTSVVLPDPANELTTALKARSLRKLADALRPLNVTITSDVTQALLVAGSSGSAWFLTDMSVSPPVHYELTKQGNALTVSVNPQLYFAPQDTKLGSLTFAQGLFLNAKLKILTFEALANVRVSLDKGLLVEGSMSRIVVGTEQLFSITAESDTTQGPRLSIATYRDTCLPTPKEMKAAQAQLLAWQQAQAQAQQAMQAWQQAMAQWRQGNSLQFAGKSGSPYGRGVGLPAGPPPAPPVLPALGPAPTLPVATSVSPHFTIDGKVVILGMRTGLYANLSEHGAAFIIEDTPMRGVTVKLHGTFSGPTDLAVGGSLLVGIDGGTIDMGKLGKVTLDANVQGDLNLLVHPVPAITMGRGRVIPPSVSSTASFAGIARALGQSISLPVLALEVNSPSLQTIQQQLTTLLTSVFKTMLSDVNVWLGYVTRGLITGVQDVSQTMTQYYKLSRDQVLALYQQTSTLTSQAGAVLKNTFGVAAPEEAARLLNQAHYTADQAGQSLNTAYGITKDGVGDVLDKGGYALGQISGTLKQVFGVADPVAAAQLLGNIGKKLTPFTIYNKVYQIPVLRSSADQLTQALGTAYTLTKDNIVSVLAPVGYPLDAISGVLLNAFHVTNPSDVAKLLKTYPADQVKSTLKTVYNASDDAIRGALGAAGYAKDVVDKALSTATSVGNTIANTGTSVIHTVGGFFGL